MRAGARRRRAHESRQCAARRMSRDMTSWRAAKYGRAESPAHTRPPGGRSERPPAGPRLVVRPLPGGVPPAPSRCAGSNPPSQRRANAPQPVVRGGRERPSQEGLIVQGQLGQGDLRRPRSLGQRPGPPNQVDDEILGPPPVWWHPRLQPRLVADGIPRYGAREGVPWIGIAGPRTRLLREEGVAVARLIPRAGRHPGREDRQIHAVQAVQKTHRRGPHPPPAPAGGGKAPPFAGRRAIGPAGPRRVVQPGEPRLPGAVPFRAVPQDVGLVLVRRAAVRARGVGAHAVTRHPGRCPYGSCEEPAQQRLLQLRGGRPQRCVTRRAVRPVAQSPEGGGAPRLQLARGVAAKAVPDPVLELAERLLHEMQGVILPWDVPAPLALARGPAKRGRRAKPAPHRARPRWAATRFLDSLGKDLRDPGPAGQAGQQEEALIPRVHDRGHSVPLGQHVEDDLLGPGHARRPPHGPYHRNFEPPHVGLRHRSHRHPMEGQRGNRGADGPLPPVIRREMG